MSHTIPHWLTKQADLSPHKEAITVHNSKSYTFTELKKMSEQFARKLATLNIKENSKVAILSSNSLQMVVAIHALSYLKSVVVLLNTRLSNEELSYQLNKARVDLLITSDMTSHNLTVKKMMTYDEINRLTACQRVILASEIDLNEPFTMMFTSGTTGHPKGVIHTYGNHWWSAISSALNLGFQKDDKWLATLPLFHVGGLSILIRSVVYGISVYLFEKYNQYEIHKVLMEEKITHVSLVTLMLCDLIEELGDDRYPSSLRCFLIGGGSIPEAILHEVKEKKLPVFQSYGMTETSSQLVTLSEEYALTKLGSSGKPLFPAQLKIERDKNEKVGEILVKGPMVIDRYDEDERINETSFTDGWLKTGDLGYIDDDGFLYVIDRRSDLIISGGENIYPSEVENKLLEIDGMKEVAVVGKDDDRWGQVPVAFIVTESELLTDEKIKYYLKDSLASYKVPKRIYRMDELPKTASRKIRRHKLAQLLKNNNIK